jgi:hypothetical protein
MRFTWTVTGDDPDWTTLSRHGITGLFAPLWDSLTTKGYLMDFKFRGFTAGLYLGHDWFRGLTGVQLAQKVDAEYKRLVLTSPKLTDVRVMFNWEQHDPEDIASGLEEWRRLQPWVGTSWSMEGMQGGWMGPVVTPLAPEPSDFVKRILACRVRLVPQAFVGNMQRRESDIVLRDLTRRGFPESSVSIFYDSAQLGADWDGFAFTAGRLP